MYSKYEQKDVTQIHFTLRTKGEERERD